VPKHRRSEIEPSRAAVRAPANTAEIWPEAVGYGQTAVNFGPAAAPGWQVAPEDRSWQEWEDWQEWGPPPALHPDHPSAPVPRVQFSDDHPSGPMPARRTPAGPESPRWRPDEPARTWGPPPRAPQAGYDTGNRRLHAVPDDGLALREVSRFQQQPGPRWQEPGDYRRDVDPYRRDREPATGRFHDGRDSLWTAGQVLTLAEGRAAQIAQQAQDYAAAVRETAEREAAAITQRATGQAATMREAAERQAAEIREAAEREAADLRARLDSMTGELGRVAAYVTENLVAPAVPATAPALPEATPALPGTSPAPPAIRPAGPRTAPARQPHEPGTRTATPGTAPRTSPGGPARQAATPTKQGQALGRQRRAMRIATAGTAALLSVAAIGAVTMTGIHGFNFFVFRESGQGETPGNFTDTDFLARQAAAQREARQAAAQHHDSAPKGRHHKATGGK